MSRSFPRPLQRPLREQIVGKMGVVLHALDGELRPVSGLFILHFALERRGDLVYDPDVPEYARAVDFLVLLIIDLELDPEVLCHPGDILRIFPAGLRRHFDYIARFPVHILFFKDAELEIVEVRRSRKIII